jgi:8-oxo-dGTP pyrophosphatase MutT (NUDIX family)
MEVKLTAVPEDGNVEVIEQISKTYEAPYKRKCVSCRAIIIKDGKILYSFESKTGFYMSPGGSLEDGEELSECLTRELLEETGYKVKPIKKLLEFHEFCYDTLYISYYYLAEIYGEGERSLTKTEEEKGMEPRWVEIDKALEIFGDYATKTPDKESLYKREFTVLNKIK